MKLYYAPGACSVGIHVLLEEIGKPYQTAAISLQKDEQHKTEFTRINPKSKVPTLVRDDGSALTEFPAIAFWLARTNPEAHLIPPDVEDQARMIEALDYIVSTIHMRGYHRLFRPAAYAPNPADEEKVLKQGHEIVDEGFGLLDKTLDGKDYLVGNFSVADAALFYVELWAGMKSVTLPGHLAAHLARMKARPAVGRVLKQEGLAS